MGVQWGDGDVLLVKLWRKKFEVELLLRGTPPRLPNWFVLRCIGQRHYRTLHAVASIADSLRKEYGV